MTQLSLIDYCQPCHSVCCKTGSLIGSPILSLDEIATLSLAQKKYLLEITSPVLEKYWIFKDQKSNICPMLDQKGKCTIEDHKPLDCLCYPIKAVYKNNQISYIIDKECPASRHLSERFASEARKIALKSIQRFKQETYNHWLSHYVGWVS